MLLPVASLDNFMFKRFHESYRFIQIIINNLRIKLKMYFPAKSTINKTKEIIFKNWSQKYGNFDILVNIFN